MNMRSIWKADNLKGEIRFNGEIVACSTSRGWHVALNSDAGAAVICAVRTAVFRLPNDAQADAIVREASSELDELLG